MFSPKTGPGIESILDQNLDLVLGQPGTELVSPRQVIPIFPGQPELSWNKKLSYSQLHLIPT